jgi:hypothetical protein
MNLTFFKRSPVLKDHFFPKGNLFKDMFDCMGF